MKNPLKTALLALLITMLALSGTAAEAKSKPKPKPKAKHSVSQVTPPIAPVPPPPPPQASSMTISLGPGARVRNGQQVPITVRTDVPVSGACEVTVWERWVDDSTGVQRLKTDSYFIGSIDVSGGTGAGLVDFYNLHGTPNGTFSVSCDFYTNTLQVANTPFGWSY